MVLGSTSTPGEDDARGTGFGLTLWVSPLSPDSLAVPLEQLCPGLRMRQRPREARRAWLTERAWMGAHRSPHQGPVCTLQITQWRPRVGPAAAILGRLDCLTLLALGCSPSTLTVWSLASSPAALWATQV